ADLVHVKLASGDVAEIIDADLVLELTDCCRCGLHAKPDEVRAARQHRLITKPNHVCRYLVSDARRGVGGGDHIAAADIDLILEGDGDSVIDPDDKPLAILRQKLFHAAVAPRGVDRDLIARPHGPRNDGAGEATKPTPRSNDALHRHAEGMVDRARGNVDSFKELHQTRPSIPG